MNSKPKVETIEEFLTRGGTVNKLPTTPREVTVDVIKNQTGGPATILTFDEVSLFYGEAKKSKAVAKKQPSIDMDALPEALRNKFLNKIKEENADGEED